MQKLSLLPAALGARYDLLCPARGLRGLCHLITFGIKHFAVTNLSISAILEVL